MEGGEREKERERETERERVDRKITDANYSK